MAEEETELRAALAMFSSTISITPRAAPAASRRSASPGSRASAACAAAVQNLMLYLWKAGVGSKWTTGDITRA